MEGNKTDIYIHIVFVNVLFVLKIYGIF